MDAGLAQNTAELATGMIHDVLAPSVVESLRT